MIAEIAEDIVCLAVIGLESTVVVGTVYFIWILMKRGGLL